MEDEKLLSNCAGVTLTDTRVRLTITEGWYTHATTIFPVSAVDSVFFGWRRQRPLLTIGATLVAIGFILLFNEQTSSAGVTAIVVGLGALCAFWFYKPRMLRIQSGREQICVSPPSDAEAEQFMGILMSTIERAGHAQ
ncbi:MAG: hypothetical protein HY077_00400 [Elusimicrobia bacterium]|nr:hypothetical protein [Elusimicrobiota bacterium]